MDDFDDIYRKNFSSRSSERTARPTDTARSRSGARTKGKGKRRAKSKNSLLSLLDFKNFKTNIKQMNKYQKRRLGAVLIAALIIILIIIIANSNKKHVIPEITTFLYNNNLVTPKNELFIEDEVSYVSMEDILNMFDENIVYDKDTKQLITTYNTHIALLKLDEKTMNLNNSEIKINGKLQEKNGLVYLPFSDLGIVYDLDVEYSNDYNRIIATSIKEEKIRSIVIKNSDLKESPSAFAKNVEKLSVGYYVYILEESGNYKKVRSENGNVGYIANGKIGNIETLRTKMIEEKNVYNVFDDINALDNYDSFSLRSDAKNVVIPFFFVLNENADITYKFSRNSDNYVAFKNWCSQNEVQIWATLDANDSVSSLFGSYEKRNEAIQELYNQVMTYEFQGIMIDFDEVDDWNSMLRFIIEIAPRFKESGLKVGVRIRNASEDISKKINNIVDVSL